MGSLNDEGKKTQFLVPLPRFYHTQVVLSIPKREKGTDKIRCPALTITEKIMGHVFGFGLEAEGDPVDESLLRLGSHDTVAGSAFLCSAPSAHP
ncbi:hypothetical protein VNO78_13593 [Psophocarpus tetragonolobus]|uniref:Uncharacterized protein n=1 Tax=Psophocarpus tetragonolobus TaxID=3891 RepID=A0AAN9SRC1_PSOTE